MHVEEDTLLYSTHDHGKTVEDRVCCPRSFFPRSLSSRIFFLVEEIEIHLYGSKRSTHTHTRLLVSIFTVDIMGTSVRGKDPRSRHDIAVISISIRAHTILREHWLIVSDDR